MDTAYTVGVRSRLGLTVILLLAAAWAVAQLPDNPVVATADGRTHEWNAWLEHNGPVAVMVWASWAPRGAAALAEADAVAAVCRERNLGFALVAVQEAFEDSARALRGVHVRWLHDRHGAVLKRHRLVRIPTLVILTADGRVVGTVEPTAEALRSWRAPQ